MCMITRDMFTCEIDVGAGRQRSDYTQTKIPLIDDGWSEFYFKMDSLKNIWFEFVDI